MTKITLKGTLYGTKKIKTYKNPDIVLSEIERLGRILDFNHLELSGKFIYFSFHDREKKYSGRWYAPNVSSSSFIWKPIYNQVVYTIPEWVDDDHIFKNVNHTITFSECGYKKFKKFFDNIEDT